METHKHSGVERSNGTLRAHPVERKHKDASAQDYHDKETGNTKLKTKTIKKIKQQQLEKVTAKRGVVCPVDNEGFILVDLTQFDLNQVGVRVKFERTEDSKKRTIGLEINK